MRTLMLMLTIASTSLVSIAYGSDCHYNRDRYRQSKASCEAGHQQICQLLPKMREIVQDSCGKGGASASSSGGKTNGYTGKGSTGGHTSDGPTDFPDADTRRRVARAYEGEACKYFTRDAVEEHDDGVTRMNYYADDTNICHKGVMFICRNGSWRVRSRNCRDWSGWRDVRSEVVEKP